MKNKTSQKSKEDGHLPLITKTIQIRQTRYAGHSWRSRDELISDVLRWTPTYGRAKAGRPARTYIQQLCEDTGCGLKDLPKAMNDREKWRERVRDIRACSTTWWWYIYIAFPQQMKRHKGFEGLPFRSKLSKLYSCQYQISVDNSCHHTSKWNVVWY